MSNDNNILDDDFILSNEVNPKNTGKIKLLRIEILEKLKILKHGRLIIIALIVLSLIMVISAWDNDFLQLPGKYGIFIEAGILITIYIVLAFFALKHSKIVFIVALIIYTLNTVSQIVLSDSPIYSGIIFRIVIIFYFVKSIKASFDLEKNLLQYYQLGGKKDW